MKGKLLQKFRKDVLGVCFQEANLLPELTVRENLAPYSRRKDSERILGDLGLTRLLETEARSLSGGEAERVAVARAILKGSSLILVDEPTASLDKENGTNVARVLREASSSALVIVASHDVSVFEPFADVLVRLAAGRLVSLERLRDPLPYEETEANDHSFELRREAGMLFKDLKRSLPSHPARLVSALLLSFTSARSSPFSSFLPARKEGGLRSGTASGRKKTLLLGFSRTSLTFALFSSHHGSKNRQAPREIGQEDSGFLYFEGNRFSNRLQFS